MSRRPDPSWLSAPQAAARLGIKPATLYAYVSRGLIPRRRGPGGRQSYFSVADVERLAKRTPHSRLAPTDIVVPTSISLVDGRGGMLWYRGVDAIEAVARHTFEQVSEFLWTGRWNEARPWHADDASLRTARRVLQALPRDASGLERIGVIIAASRSADANRDDRSSDGILRTGRNLLATLVDALPQIGTEQGGWFAARLWSRLTAASSTDVTLRLLDHVLGVAAEHGVTLSVVAARLAAGSGADLYSAVSSALGPASGAIESSRFDALEALLGECERTGNVVASVDAMIEREGRALGVSADPYPKGDPRARFVLQTVKDMSTPRASVVDATASALRARGRAEPDMSFATAATCFVCDFAPRSSELITAVARTAGWVAHAASEYHRPTPFRPHATYVGVMPAPEQREGRELLHAVMEYLRED